ncbi:MAG: hypothetical protein Q9179_007237 [Wetmoreana sp. 5 TL-2023]
MSGISSDENKVPSPPPAPPLPPQRYGNRAASAIARFAQPFIYASRPPSAQGDRPPEPKVLGTRSIAQRSSSPASRTTVHKTGLPINAFDISPSRTHAVLAGREILKTIHVTESACTEDFNLRASIIAYAAAHDSSGGTISARHRDQLAATDVKWAHGKYNSTIATAAANGQIVIYDINRPGVELARLHEHSRQVHRIAFNPHQGALLLSGSQDSTIRLWDLRALARDQSVMTCRSIHKYPGNNEGIRDLRWSPTEGVEFAAGTDNGVVQRWDLQKPNAPLLKINAHEQTCYSVDWHPDGKHLASGGADKNVKVWDFSSADRRMKACWQLRVPKPVLNVRWRPSSWRSEEATPGHWTCTHIATSYDNQDPRIHVWDLRRPSVPSRELDRYETPPSALLWHSESLLWSVGVAGIFTQSDINFANRVSEKQSPNTVAIAPDGKLALFLEKRARRRVSAEELDQHFIQRNGRTGSSGEKLSSSYSATEGSLDEPSLLLNSSLRARRRKTPSTRSSRSLAGTPPSLGSEGPALDLDEALRKDSLHKTAQTAAYGDVRSVFEAEIFTFLAHHYKLDVPPGSRERNMICQSLPRVFLHNADVAAYAGQYRLAQSWRIMALALQKELEARADRSHARRSSSAQRLFNNGKEIIQVDPITLKEDYGIRTNDKSQSGAGKVLMRPPAPLSVESGSNMTTPVARPVPNASMELRNTSTGNALDGRDSLELPEPIFGKRSPQRPTEKTSALSTLRSPTENDDDTDTNSIHNSAELPLSPLTQPYETDEYVSRDGGFHDIDRRMSERRAAMENYRTTPRPLLRLEDSLQTTNGNPLVPRFDRHNSNESFQMFSASTDSSHRARSMASSFESSQASRSSGPIPEGWSLARRPSNARDPRRLMLSSDSRDRPPSYDISQQSESAPEAMSSQSASDQPLERPTSTTRIIHLQDTIANGQSPNTENAQPNEHEANAFIDADFLPSLHDPPPPPWTATAMLGPLIDFHLNRLSDTQLPAHLLLLLGPYIANNLIPAFITSILLTYHSRLVSLGLYVQAAELRKVASSHGHSELAEHGTYDMGSVPGVNRLGRIVRSARVKVRPHSYKKNTQPVTQE